MVTTAKGVFRRFSIVALLMLASISLVNSAKADQLGGNLTVDNAVFVYVSTSDSTLGTLVASGNNWQAPLTISSALLTPGETNYLQVEAINYGIWGGFIGQFTLSDNSFQFANGSQTLLTNTADWTGSYNSVYFADTPWGTGDACDPSSGAYGCTVSAQPWVPPTGGVTSFGPNSVSPWGTVSGISSDANWIWPSDSNRLPGGIYGACHTCTVDFSPAITPTPEPGTLTLLTGGLALLPLIRRRRKTR